jgi:ribose 5-phosphate isomerase A
MLEARAGIAEHGLFVGLATDLIVAGPSGVRELRAREQQ